MAVLGTLTLGYWLVATDSYALTTYHVPECHKMLTVMVINSASAGERQVAFIPGEYHEHCLPKQDYLLAHLPSGLDGGFICYLTCHESQLVVHYYEGRFLPTESSALIVAHREQNEDNDLAAQALADIPNIIVE